MKKKIFIPQAELSKIIGVSLTVLHTYLGHFTLFKYVGHTYKYNKDHRFKQKIFFLNPDSIYALQEYLKLKMKYGVNKKNIKLSGIEELKKLYKEKSLE